MEDYYYGALEAVRYAPEAGRAEIIEEALNSHDLSVRRRAAKLIEHVAEADREKLIRKGLKDENSSIRNYAIEAINSMPKNMQDNLQEGYESFGIPTCAILQFYQIDHQMR